MEVVIERNLGFCSRDGKTQSNATVQPSERIEMGIPNMTCFRLRPAAACFSLLFVGAAVAVQQPGDCPTAIIAQYPQGNGEMLCMWELSDCSVEPASSSGFVYASCDGEACTCVVPNCESGPNEPEIEPTEEVPVDDETPDPGEPPEEEPPGNDPPPEDPPGSDPPAAGAAQPRSEFILTQQNQARNLGIRQKKLRSNGKRVPFVIPAASRLVPSQPDTIMEAFGVGNHRVKYLKSLRATAADNQREYYALYKVFRIDPADPNGNQDRATDHYVGIRMGAPAGNPAGGFAQVNFRTETGRVKKLAPFTGPNSHVREVAVRIAIPARGGNGGSRNKWFHLFGTVM